MYLVYQYTAGILVLFIVIHEFVEAISFETKFDSQFLRLFYLLDLKMFKMIFFFKRTQTELKKIRRFLASSCRRKPAF